ncbi:DUF423 domain-containing protein [Lutimonas zeaxanthinifaciens]|uniref:DUF423 domain-containing protein n=1 Tax=Lutimonas zeaxanthinifaciens TaxID=3060215 RepID=UPI00265D39E4|nr:DUF423 domain-containing protein [Lutimonas sp. YSD2104]WKK66737.1 DUF423 domain-containing protein [Lutimonas sp. YSD2104]
MVSKISGIAALLGVLGIALGAFGAHSLKDKLNPENLLNFETGVRYMMYHVLGILLVNNSFLKDGTKLFVCSFFFLGILFFSGSLFVISTGFIEAKEIWFITPLGGLLFISGWFVAAIGFFKGNADN